LTAFPWRFAPAGAPRTAPGALAGGGLTATGGARPDMGPQRGVVEVEEAPGEAGIVSGELEASVCSFICCHQPRACFLCFCAQPRVSARDRTLRAAAAHVRVRARLAFVRGQRRHAPTGLQEPPRPSPDRKPPRSAALLRGAPQPRARGAPRRRAAPPRNHRFPRRFAPSLPPCACARSPRPSHLSALLAMGDGDGDSFPVSCGLHSFYILPPVNTSSGPDFGLNKIQSRDYSPGKGNRRHFSDATRNH